MLLVYLYLSYKRNVTYSKCLKHKTWSRRYLALHFTIQISFNSRLEKASKIDQQLVIAADSRIFPQSLDIDFRIASSRFKRSAVMDRHVDCWKIAIQCTCERCAISQVQSWKQRQIGPRTSVEVLRASSVHGEKGSLVFNSFHRSTVTKPHSYR